jgi:hypothetical protein
MRKLLLITAFALGFAIALTSFAWGADGCTTIKDGTLIYSPGHYLAGQPLKPGYDPYGYNYQAHMFNGYYPNVYLGGDGYPPYEGDPDAYLEENPDAAYKWYWYPDVTVQMKWNDEWLSNEDCDMDGNLDRPDSYIGSGAWETNHQSGSYQIEVNGKLKDAHWIYFVKIVAVPSDAYLEDDYWYTADGVQIGEVIWGSFAIIQQVYNDPFEGVHGKLYVSPAGPGFGQYH